MPLRDIVLQELRQQKGQVLSGRALAERLHVSRTAVWKAIEELRRDGYTVDASTNRGYALISDSDRLTEYGIRSHLPDQFREYPLYVHDTLQSTNQTAKELALNGAPDGTVVIADHQTGGRGRRGRSFFSPEGVGLYLTMVFRTHVPAAQAVRITTAASVATARAIDRVAGTQMQIKWINDLYLNGRKLCGILTDGATNMENGSFEYVVVGIGINVNTPTSAFPAELQETAGSIRSETGRHTDRCALAAALIEELYQIRSELSECTYIDEYRLRSCVLGRRIRVFGMGYEGEPATAEFIDEEGHLYAKLDDGTTIGLHSGEITIRPEDARTPFSG